MPNKFALIIGNSDYQDRALAQLAMPQADVNGLVEVLKHPQVGGFDDVMPLVNSSAAEVRLEIESFFADKKPDDLLLLYFTGHGVRDDQGQLYLAVNDTKHNRLRATAIGAAYVTGEMDRSRSRRRVLILDCCHSGSFAQGSKGVTGESVGIKAAFEGIGYGRVVLTATDATQYAWEGDQVIGEAQNSVFTHYLLNGLRTGEADTDADGSITLDELYDYVYDKVVSVTPKQTPGKWSFKQQGEIVIAHNPHLVVKPVALPPELQQAIESPFSGVREGAVRELERLLPAKNAGLALAAQEALKQLAEDDSRRVASVAAQVLQSIEQPSSERTARANFESRAAQQVAAERAAGQTAQQARQDEQQAKAQRVARQSVPAGSAPTTGAKWLGLNAAGVWQPTVLTTLGWGLAYLVYVIVSASGLISYYGVSTGIDLDRILKWISNEASSSPVTHLLKWAMIGVMGGGAIGLVLRRRDSAIQRAQIWIIAIGWGIAYAIGVGFGGAIIASTSKGAFDTIAWIVVNVVSGMLGGLISGLTLRLKYPTLQRGALLIVVFGWGIASLVSWALVFAVLAGRGHKAVEAFVLFGGIAGLIAGAIGSAVMYWQLQRARQGITPTVM